MNKFVNVAFGSVLLACTAGAAATDGMSILKGDCSGCHDLNGPAPATLQELRERKGPDLFYAGNKYRQEWLESWLQEPTRIRPAGMFYADHVTTSEEGDLIDESGLGDHPALSAADAEAVASALMTLRAGDELIKSGEYKEGTIGLSMGEMMFDKFRGCLACHEIEPGYGGLSGPEVYTAAKRLQPDWMISYMRDPQAWDPRSFMPNRRLTDSDLQKLVHYMRALAEEVE
jgi:mono/diheme cytochrome c family protein